MTGPQKSVRNGYGDLGTVEYQDVWEITYEHIQCLFRYGNWFPFLIRPLRSAYALTHLTLRIPERKEL